MTSSMKLASALLTLAIAVSPAAWPQQQQSSTSAQEVSSSEKGSISAYRNSPEHYYQLKFRVLNLSADGKVTNSRSYSEIIASGAKSAQTSSIRTEDRFQLVTGGHQTGITSSLVNTQYQYFDIGTKIDANSAEVVDQTLRIHVLADITSISTTAPGSAERPVIRHTSWDSNVTVPINKPTLIFSSDNNADKGKTELELTAVPISQ